MTSIITLYHVNYHAGNEVSRSCLLYGSLHFLVRALLQQEVFDLRKASELSVVVRVEHREQTNGLLLVSSLHNCSNAALQRQA